MSPFLLSLSAQACNVEITRFRPLVSTDPWLLVLLLLLFLQSKRSVDQGGINVRPAHFREYDVPGRSSHRNVLWTKM